MCEIVEVTWRVEVTQHASAYLSIRQQYVSNTSAHDILYTRIFVMALRTYADVCYVSIRQHASACVSMRQHTSAYISMRQHTSAYASIRQHTSAYVSIRPHTWG